MQGWVKLHRKLVHNEMYFCERFSRIAAWIDLILLASHKKHMVVIKGKEIDLKPGQLCYSKRSLSDRWKWDRKTINKFFKYLEKEQMIEQADLKVTTVITLKNWNEYQNLEYNIESETC